MADLIEFLRARLEEKENSYSEIARWSKRAMDLTGGPGHEYFCAVSSAELILQYVAATRLIIEEHKLTRNVVGYGMPPEANHGFGCEICHDWDGATEGYGYCTTIKALVLPYRSHPEYDEAWRPEPR